MIRVGLIGHGYWGANLARNLADSTDLDLAVVCDTDLGRLDDARRRYPAARCTLNADTVFGYPDVEAVVIAAPASAHYPLAVSALDAGKHVLVAKPLAQTVADAEQLEQLALARGLVLMVDHTFVYTGAVRKMKELVDGGLGRLLYFDSVRVNLGRFQSDADVIWDLAPHDLSILDHLTAGTANTPTFVRAVGADHLNRGYADMAYLHVEHAGGLVAHIHVNWLSPVKIRRTLLAGEQRMLVYDDLEPSEKVRVYDRGASRSREALLVDYRYGDMHAPKLDFTEALAVECQTFADCIIGGAANMRSLSDAHAGVNVVRVLEAASRSLAAGGDRVLV